MLSGGAALASQGAPSGVYCVPGRAAVAFGAVDPSPGALAPVDPKCVSFSNIWARRGPEKKAGIAIRKVSFLNRNERRYAATIEVAKRAQLGPLRSWEGRCCLRRSRSLPRRVGAG